MRVVSEKMAVITLKAVAVVSAQKVNGANGGGGKGEKWELYLDVAFCICNSLFERFFGALTSFAYSE